MVEFNRVLVGSLFLAVMLSVTLAWASGSGTAPSLVRAGTSSQAARTPTTLARGGTGSRAAGGSTFYYYFPVINNNTIIPPLAPLWRFGIARVRRPITDYNATEVTLMRFGWYVDWGAGGSDLPTFGMEYVPTIRVRQLKLNGLTPTASSCYGCPYVTPYTYTLSLSAAQIQSFVSSRHPGMMWVIGNEIERRDWPGGGQDEIVPELYAQAYHDAYLMIKSADPTAQIAIGGVIEATPLRLQYLERVWNEYSTRYGGVMPVDVWNVHAFILPEKSCATYPGDCWGADIPAGLPDASGSIYTPAQNKDFNIAIGHIQAMRAWMKNHGQQSKPLIITEYGVNFASWWDPSIFSAEQVRDSYMYPSFNYFLNSPDCNLSQIDGCRLVQRWNWYSMDDDSPDSYGFQAYNGNLFYSGLQATPAGLSTLGAYWRQYVQPLPPGSVKPY